MKVFSVFSFFFSLSLSLLLLSFSSFLNPVISFHLSPGPCRILGGASCRSSGGPRQQRQRRRQRQRQQRCSPLPSPPSLLLLLLRLRLLPRRCRCRATAATPPKPRPPPKPARPPGPRRPRRRSWRSLSCGWCCCVVAGAVDHSRGGKRAKRKRKRLSFFLSASVEWQLCFFFVAFGRLFARSCSLSLRSFLRFLRLWDRTCSAPRPEREGKAR